MVDLIQETKLIKEKAIEEKVPIITDDGLSFLMNYIKDNNIKKILEIGTAVAYSTIMMALVRNDIEVTSIERDEKRYLQAIKNVKKLNLENRITLIYNDALNVSLDDKYDLIFIDAAKAQSINFFERFEKNLNDGGTIITDNMSFHGLVNKPLEEIESRNVRGLVRKINDYHKFLEQNDNYETKFYKVGDGIALSIKK